MKVARRAFRWDAWFLSVNCKAHVRKGVWSRTRRGAQISVSLLIGREWSMNNVPPSESHQIGHGLRQPMGKLTQITTGPLHMRAFLAKEWLFGGSHKLRRGGGHLKGPQSVPPPSSSMCGFSGVPSHCPDLCPSMACSETPLEAWRLSASRNYE